MEVEGLLLTAGVRPFVTLMEPPLPSNEGVQLETHLAIHPKPPTQPSRLLADVPCPSPGVSCLPPPMPVTSSLLDFWLTLPSVKRAGAGVP